ncbi:MAG: hypothetical protein KC425_06565 [Anaerolineales bacterium]|nr:hypothetical protein [Anaerolineales bacterium]
MQFTFMENILNLAHVFMLLLVVLGFLPMLYSIYKTWLANANDADE